MRAKLLVGAVLGLLPLIAQADPVTVTVDGKQARCRLAADLALLWG